MRSDLKIFLFLKHPDVEASQIFQYDSVRSFQQMTFLGQGSCVAFGGNEPRSVLRVCPEVVIMELEVDSAAQATTGCATLMSCIAMFWI